MPADQQDIPLETNIGKLVYLDALQEADLPIMFEWINNEALVSFNSYFKPVTYQQHEEWFAAIINNTATRIFAIRLKEDNSLVGSCQLHSIHPIYKSAELQIRLGDLNLTSKGYGSEAVALLLAVGFNQLELERIYLHVFDTNERAIKSYAKNGFVQEGRLRKAAFINEAFVDVMVMAVLKEDYPNNKHKNF